WELLVLRPFVERTDLPRMLAAASAPVFVPPSLRRSDVPPSIDEIMQRALSVRPEDRYGSADELLSAFAAAGYAEREPFVPPAKLALELEARARKVSELLRAPEPEETGDEDTVVFAQRTIYARPLSPASEPELTPTDPAATLLAPTVAP